jgi:cell division protein FtsW
MIYSVTAGKFGEHPEESYATVTKHMVGIGMGIVAFLAMMNLDYHRLKKRSAQLLALVVLLLIGVLAFGTVRNGAKRWFAIYGSFTFQPSELAKIIVPIFVAAFVSARSREELRSFRRGFLLSVSVICVVAGLILLQPDFGTSVLIGAVGLLTLVVFGLNLGYTALMIIPGALFMAAVALAVPYMRERVVIWLDPWRDPQGAGYHIIQSLTAIGSGGLLGKGLGWSQQKLWYLPEAHTDFIFSIIGEEFGLLGTAGVILLFVLLLREGIRVARNAPDIFGSALAFGITMMISIQAAFNVAVTTKALPTKGIALPFISFGGSSMLFTLAAVGILVNVARHCVEPVPAVAPAPAPVSPLAPAPAPASASVAPAASSAPSSVSST